MLLRSAAKREVRIPRSIGPYKVERLLASGGMGDVYLCLDERLGKKVAVKLARPELASEPGLMDQIRDEGRRLASVKRNVYVARVLTAGDQAIDGVSVPYVAMEYEEGEPLGGPISNAWPIRKKVEVFTNVCKAVEALHEQHLVHADIKPSNIILAGEEPRLIDFGIARVVRRLGGEPGQLCAGTPGYFDPAVGGTTGKAPDQRTDIYCLGLTLAAFLAGKEPNADQPSGWPSRGIPPSTENPAIDAELDAIILKAIERDPSKRHQSVAEFRGALAGWSVIRRVPLRVLAMVAMLVVSVWCGWKGGIPIANILGEANSVARAAFATPLPSELPLDHCAVVGLQSTDELKRVAELLGTAGTKFDQLNLASARTWRPVYPALLRALQDSEAKVVTFDIVFKKPSDVDALFYETARECPFPIVVGLDLGSLEDEPLDAPNKTILRWPLQWGGVTAFFQEDAPWCADVLARRGDRYVRPMLSMRTLASWNFPKMRHRFVAPDAASVVIDAEVNDPGSDVISRPVQDVVNVQVSGTDIAQMESIEDRRESGILDTDQVSQVLFAIPSQPVLDSITHSLLDVLRATPSQRQTWFKGRAVFVANMTPVATDKFGSPDGREIWGVYGHAAAFEAMLTGKAIRVASGTAVVVIACAFAALPPMLVSRVRARKALKTAACSAAVTVGTVLVVMAISYVLLRKMAICLPPWQPVLTAISAGVLVVVASMLIPKRSH
ncbi:MAG TPA: CHASE2 domain-containing protein [Phycisphaerales bacterium]|nr:CHASE2 domain-containing protein [Phycisphaerales bacterium]